nr:immunoglobulin heavy chain junction region [Macaca mulatta]MPN83968.1 immunoglobulin heavy chain junction region [Macaca mulatta]MPN84053.1 immunoglobulin heavy chain junction region [Macaca mulatta]MPN84055.1 immunoglobulin heavy chain junction region [Macaca mulatta]MPN84063.1 immunoglobulin heavy chain junction region [Macaca mulatta]
CTRDRGLDGFDFW